MSIHEPSAIPATRYARAARTHHRLKVGTWVSSRSACRRALTPLRRTGQRSLDREAQPAPRSTGILDDELGHPHVGGRPQDDAAREAAVQVADELTPGRLDSIGAGSKCRTMTRASRRTPSSMVASSHIE